jgi:histidinol-phosphate phosphatase family protein
VTVSRAEVAVVIPTIGRAELGDLIRTIALGDPAPVMIVVADDRPDPAAPLDLPELPVPVRVVRSRGRGPAAARNAGWLATDTAWVAFVDDDVRLSPDWSAALARDLADLPASVGASTARIVVPLPEGRRPTDEERRTVGLASARWITADMAYRREALLATGGFDERFPRAFREDSDLATRTIRAGFEIVAGERVTEHPIRARGGWVGSIRAQAGNADNALLRRKFGRHWRKVIGEPEGRTGRHLLTVAAAATALGGLLTGRRAPLALGVAGWATLTAEFAVRRILPGPRTAAEVAAMIISSAAIPPVALFHRLRGEVAVRRSPNRRPARALLFDRDGTLIHDVPYLADPDGVRPVAGAAEALAALRRLGVPVGVVSNQSGVARGLIGPADLSAVNERVEALLGPFDTWQVCVHRDEDGCGCRKPAPALIQAAARDLGVAPADCVMVGDIGADVQAARSAGARAILVPTPVTRPSEVAHARTSAVVAEDVTAAVRYALAGRW